MRRFATILIGLCATLALLTGATPAPAGKRQSSTSAATNWWSLQPLKQPPLPKTKDQAWARTPIDQFILAQLEANGLRPSAPADKRTLLRRVYFDLLGLPPTPEQMAAFLGDASPQAFERVADSLLASPRYGERWARHWMDAVHYAETHGHDQDRVRPNAWPYRDWLIRAFNDDKLYARFVQEQVAGDVLFPDNPALIPALGFLATGPWDESSLRDIREDTIDRQVARYLDRDDIVTTVMATFTSTTVHCARCHDHKFDPIPQADYYALQAVFAGTDKANRSFEADPVKHHARQSLLAQKSALDRKDKTLLAALLEPARQAEVAAWEKSLTTKSVEWTVLEPASFAATNGSTLTKQPDHSLLASGKRPETDTYTITTHTELKGITAVRLEVLADDNLPHKGPGRQDNGNLHLSEFKVFAQPRNITNASTTTSEALKARNTTAQGNALGSPSQKETSPEGAKPPTQPRALQNPTADFNQEAWPIAHAIDGKEKTAWGIYPQVGKAHVAFFELKEPIPHEGGVTLTFVLEQLHGGGHLIGRPRLSVTTAPLPVRVNPFPDNITKILATPATQRTDEQQTELGAFVHREQLDRQLATLGKPQLVYAGASEFEPDGSFKPAGTPRTVHLLKRGDISKPGDLATPGALACVNSLASRFDDMDNEGARRAALALWLTDPQHPLTWRSIVNRVWHHHFGRGLVETLNDFGRMGAQPSHAELLDWLAAGFRDSGGSLKRLHKLIVMSAVYQQAASVQYSVFSVQSEKDSRSKFGTEHWKLNTEYFRRAAAADSDNRLLWRMNPRRLDAECVRDATLAITGQLDLTMGGPSAQQFVLSPGIHVTPLVDYTKFDVDSAASRRRSVYRFIFRTLPDPFMDCLDCADASQLTPARSTSVNALQALAMLNNHFIVRQSEHFATRVTALAKDWPAQLTAAYQLALNREPTQEELADLTAYATKHGLANACRLILNSNEFMFVQ